jgi:methylated-DNA-[protein]-cysteine S-methyltransferase
MQYISYYESPLGKMMMAADDIGLTGLWFEDEKYFAENLDPEHVESETPVIKAAKKWLDKYFAGEKPGENPPLHLTGSDFQKEVAEILLRIPYGETMTYAEIANVIAENRNIPKMAPQAVGGAVGHNPISIVVPCHRVMGAHGNLTGYGGKISRKIALLKLENVDVSNFYVPKHGTAL